MSVANRHPWAVMLTVAGSVVAMAAGLGVLVGWLLDLPVLRAGVLGAAPMNPATAVALVVAGLGLLLTCFSQRSRRYRLSVLACGLGVLAIGLLCASDYVLGTRFDVDRVLFAHKLVETLDGRTRLNAMAPNTALVLILLGLSLLGLDRRRWRSMTDWTAAGVVAIAWLALAGYAVRLSPLFRFDSHMPMAIPTAVAALAVGLGLLAARPDQGWTRILAEPLAGGAMARRLLPLLLVLPVLIGLGGLAAEHSGWLASGMGLPFGIVASSALTAFAVILIAERVNRLDQRQRELEGERQTWVLRRHQVEARERLADYQRQLAEAIPQLVWVSRPDGCIEYVNQRLLDYTGQTPPDAKRGGWLDGMHPDDVAQASRIWGRSLSTGEPFEFEYRLKDRHGHYRWFLARGMRIPGAGGHDDKWIGTSTDIEALKQSEAQNALARREVEGALHARDDFLSVASHELRTPLTSMQLLTEGLLRRLGDTAVPSHVLRPKLVTLHRQVDRLISLVGEMLELARINSGRLHLELEDLDLTSLVREVVDRYDDAVRASGSLVSIEGEAGLIVRSDRLRLEQVVINLLTNALKYGKGKPVTFRLNGTGSQVALTVEDQGIGIAAADQARLFKPFERLVSSRNYGGLGLGLWIVHQFVTAMGGHISVRSQAGQGTAFTVFLPLRSVSERTLIQAA